jgi:hypothetical protein
MFTEEQFEVYRGLGFHATYQLFDRSDRFAHLEPAVIPDVRSHMAVLDSLFPRVAVGGAPGQKLTFSDWLPRPRRRPTP